MRQKDMGCNNIAFSPDPSQGFTIVFTDASTTSQPIRTLPMFPSSVPSTSTAPHTETPTPRGVLLYLVVTLLIIVIISVLAQTIICIRRKCKPKGSTGGKSDGMNLEFPQVAPDFSYENCPPVFTLENSTYQSIDPASRDPDISYSTISQIQHT